MNDTSSHNSFSASGESPVPVPAPEAAWENMLHKLEKEMPASGTLPLAVTQKRPAQKGMVLLLFIVSTMSVLLIADNRNVGLRNHVGTLTENNMKTPTANNATAKISSHRAPVQNNTDEKTSHTATTLNSSKNTPTDQQKLEYPVFGISLYKNKKANAGIYRKQPLANKKKAIRELGKSASTKATASHNVASKAPELFQNPIPAKQASTKRKPDSAQQEPVVSLTTTLLLRTGLYWAEPLPFAGSAHYFAGAHASAQRYAMFVPGVWVSLTAEEGSFALELHPLATALLPEKAFATTQRNMDSSVVTTTKALLKVSGFSAGLHYHQKLGSGWWLGGGFQGNWWKKGLVETTTTVEKRDASNHTTVTEQKERKAYALNSTDVPDFAKFQLFMHADLLYKARIWEAGVRTGVTFMPLAQKDGPKNQQQASLFFRLCLLQKEITTK